MYLHTYYELFRTKKTTYIFLSQREIPPSKKMFKKANCTVTYLQRIEFGPLKLNDLPLGEFRALTQEELDALKS
jgi:16S rRNA pseudouridine516 synthase